MLRKENRVLIKTIKNVVMDSMADYRIKVLADHRESASGVLDFLQALPGTIVEITTLSTGDYLVADQVLFERKTATDFAASLVDGRLFSQAAAWSSNRCGPLMSLREQQPIGLRLVSAVSRCRVR